MLEWGALVAVGSIILYHVSKKNRFFLVTTGIGIGMVFGSFYTIYILRSLFP